MKLYRSTLFVPGNRAAWITKAPKYGPDALMIDLEDAVPIAEKREARGIVRAGIEQLRDTDIGVFVRLNGIDTGLTSEDIEAVVTSGLDAVAVPKLETIEQVLKVDAWLEHFERKADLPIGSVKLMALPETARGIMDAYKLATACPRVAHVIGGVGARSGDVTRAVGFKWTREGLESLYMASHVLLAARAAGVEYPIGIGSLEVGDLDLVRFQLKRGREIGFRGVLLIHPAAVPIANELFAPSEDEIAWNKGVLQAMADAEKAGIAAVTYDGMMIDYAHVRNAKDLLEQARSFGLDVGELAHIDAL
ncbi:MAG: CoA ester lyase [Gammaproteobacteria bacterium]|nr:CoA ester lyase [Gammaproteobacteria bacterium]